MSVVDTRSLAILNTVNVPGMASAIAVDARTGRAFVVDSPDATVSVLDARSGAVLRTVAAGGREGTAALAVDAHAGRVFVINPLARLVSALDARSGTVRRVIPLPESPVAVAVDEPGGHAFILNSGNTAAVVSDPWAWLPGWLRRWLPVPAPPAREEGVTVLDTARL